MPTSPEQRILDEAQAALDRDEYESALDLVNKALESSPNSSTAFTLRGQVLSSQDDWGNKDWFLADFTRAIQLDPDNAEAYHGRGKRIPCYRLHGSGHRRSIKGYRTQA